MLERTLATSFEAGTNLRGDVAGANWLYLLPSLELEAVLCLGAPSSASLRALTRLGTVWIWADERALAPLTPLERWGAVARVDRGAGGALTLPDNSADLVVVTGGVSALLSGGLLDEVCRVLRPDGSLWAELRGPRAWVRRNAVLARLRSALGSAALYWLSPLDGEVHTAVPLRQGAVMQYFLARRLYSPTLTLQRLKRARRSLAGGAPSAPASARAEPSADGEGALPGGGPVARVRRAVFGLLDQTARVEGVLHRHARAVTRHGVLAGRRAVDDPAPPAYVRQLAEARGIDLAGFRWGLWAGGAYSSRKLLFHLFAPQQPAPAYLVKMVRDPVFNDRLENEWRALERLAALRVGEGTLPRVAFAGWHAGLAIVGETMVDGRPFRDVARWSGDDPALHAGIEWLTALGTQTAQPGASPAQAAAVLDQLFAQFRAIYHLDPAHERFLSEQLDALREQAGAFPLVFQHGDPGTWNVIVTPDGQPAFLDWESAEADGMPLWDLLHFLRSYVVSAARAAGQHNRLAAFAGQFIDPGGLSVVLVRAVRAYRDRLGLAAPVAEALFYTCWMHRALKQATMLAPERVDRDGHYAQLLRLCIQRREGPTLRQFFEM